MVENLKSQNTEINSEIEKFNKIISVAKKDIFHLVRKSLLLTRGTNPAERQNLQAKYQEIFEVEKDNYSSHLYSQSQWKAENVKEVKTGSLNNIAPTVLKLMNLNIPSEMDEPLI